MELTDLRNDEISNPEIRARDATSSRCAYTRHLLATEAGQEAGLLSIDLLPAEEKFVIYEIFVPTALRRRGIGSRLLQAAEDMAKRMGYKWTLLVPKTLDEAFSQQAIEKWYAKEGYTPLEEAPNGAVIKRIL